MGTSDDPVRLASIGLGWWGGELAAAVAAIPGCELATCFARTESVRDEFSARFGCRSAPSFESVLADDAIDALLIATPHRTHPELIAQAAAAGKHVFVEKPFTLTVDEGLQAIADTRRAGVVLSVGHHRRRMPATRRLKQLVDAGELGTVLAFEATFHLPKGQRPGWRADPVESPAGAMTALGIHMVDSFHYLAGRFRALSALTTSLVAEHTLDDMTTVQVAFESGPVATLGTSLLLPKRSHLGVYGTAASAWSAADGERLELQPVGDPDPHVVPVDPVDPVVEEIAEFVRCIRTGEAPETGGQEALDVVAVLEAIVASASSETVVPVRYVDTSVLA